MQEQDMQKFLEWLPTKFEEFQNKSLDEVVNTLNTIYETEEGAQAVETLIDTYLTEQNSGNKFYSGGKLDKFVQLHKKGGSINSCSCGCPMHHVMEKGGVIEKCACGCKNNKVMIQKGEHGFSLPDVKKDFKTMKKKVKKPMRIWNKMEA